LYKTFGFGPGGLEAPQASAMAAVLEPLMTNQPAPWLAYLAGIFIAIILEMIKVPALAFALGMYLPIHLNTPILIGGIIAYVVSTRSKDEQLNTARREKGTLIASGFIAGGAIMGVISAFIIYFGQLITDNQSWNIVFALGEAYQHWAESAGAEALGFFMFLLLCVYMIWDSLRVKNQK
jgi:uncharacterized oligopeptide transporter (OPT) family protein